MIDVNSIKSQVNIVEYIRQHLPLHKKGERYWGICPLHEEKTASFSVSDKTQRYKCYGCGKEGDVVQFVQEYYGISFVEALKKLSEDLELSTSSISSLLVNLRKYGKISKDEKFDNERIYLDESEITKYRKVPIYEWLKEGISQSVLDRYNVRYHTNARRIVFPIRDNEGRIFSFSGRTVEKNWKEMGLRKYTHYYKIGTNDFLFGYYEHKKDIEEANECIVFEAPKSVMKLETWGKNNSVALTTSNVDFEQIKILVRMKCRDIVIALDKHISLSKIKQEFYVLSKMKNLYVILDKKNLLKDVKDAPVDRGQEIWEQLYKERIRI